MDDFKDKMFELYYQARAYAEVALCLESYLGAVSGIFYWFFLIYIFTNLTVGAYLSFNGQVEIWHKWGWIIFKAISICVSVVQIVKNPAERKAIYAASNARFREMANEIEWQTFYNAQNSDTSRQERLSDISQRLYKLTGSVPSEFERYKNNHHTQIARRIERALRNEGKRFNDA